jgi:DNA-binding GntR family transcriptional regulator
LTDSLLIPALKPVVRRAANLQIYDQIRAAISGGQFKPGDTLSTRQIAEALSISQMPVREAFHRLVAEGALENRPNRTIGLPVMGRQEFGEITELRFVLEGLAAAKAAGTISTADITALKKLVRGMESEPGSRQYLDFNRQFHFKIYQACGSATLERTIAQLWLRVGPLLNWSASRTDSVNRSSRYHREAITALEKRSAEAAQASIVGDIREAAEIVTGQLELP